jgi:hypothetical protein
LPRDISARAMTMITTQALLMIAIASIVLLLYLHIQWFFVLSLIVVAGEEKIFQTKKIKMDIIQRNLKGHMSCLWTGYCSANY